LLTFGNNYGGWGVFDYLFPQVENLTGKIVFVLAGCSKQKSWLQRTALVASLRDKASAIQM
jgi:hypothetical protein